MGPLGRPLGGLLGASWGLLGTYWAPLGGLLGASWGPLGGILGLPGGFSSATLRYFMLGLV